MSTDDRERSASGRQAERTALAWNRTLLSFLVVDCLLVLHASSHLGQPAKLILVAYAALSLPAMVFLGWRRRVVLMSAAEPESLSASVVICVGSTVVVAALAALVAAFAV